MIFLYYPACSTCKEVKRALEEQQVEFVERDIKVNNPTYDELKIWWQESGLPLKKFFNTSGMIYKSMHLKDKLDSMDTEQKLKLLASDGMLVKRPIMIDGMKVRIGKKDILNEYTKGKK